MTLEEVQLELAGIIGNLRCDDGPEGKAFDCNMCSYKGPAATVGCCCYEEWAPSCTPQARGPGCPNGSYFCPACGGDNGRDEEKEAISEALMALEELLGKLNAK